LIGCSVIVVRTVRRWKAGLKSFSLAIPIRP
jgi:hypothetical protein